MPLIRDPAGIRFSMNQTLARAWSGVAAYAPARRAPVANCRRKRKSAADPSVKSQPPLAGVGLRRKPRRAEIAPVRPSNRSRNLFTRSHRDERGLRLFEF